MTFLSLALMVAVHFQRNKNANDMFLKYQKTNCNHERKGRSIKTLGSATAVHGASGSEGVLFRRILNKYSHATVYPPLLLARNDHGIKITKRGIPDDTMDLTDSKQR